MTNNKQDPSPKNQAKAPAEPQEQSFGDAVKDMTTKPMPRGVAIGLLVALAIAVVSITLMSQLGGVAKMRGWIENAGIWAPLVYIGLKAATYVVAPLSGTPVRLAGGALFGFWDGAFYVLAGDMLGASLNFWIARLFRNGGIARLAGSKAIKQVDALMDKVGGWRVLLAARLLLGSLYDFISYAAGLSKLPYRHFFWASLAGGIPTTLLAAWIGNGAVTNPSFLYITATLSALALLTVIFMQGGKKLKRSKPSDKEG